MKTLVQDGDEIPVDLDADDVTGASGEQIGQPAGARTDLEHQVVRRQLRGIDQTPHEVAVDQKVLSEALAWMQPGGGKGSLDFPLGLNVFHACGGV